MTHSLIFFRIYDVLHMVKLLKSPQWSTKVSCENINHLIQEVFPTVLDLKYAVDRELLKGNSDFKDVYVSFLIY